MVPSHILNTNINCDFRSLSPLRLCAFAPLRFLPYNAKSQRRKDAKGVISVVTSFVSFVNAERQRSIGAAISKPLLPRGHDPFITMTSREGVR